MCVCVCMRLSVREASVSSPEKVTDTVKTPESVKCICCCCSLIGTVMKNEAVCILLELSHECFTSSFAPNPPH